MTRPNEYHWTFGERAHISFPNGGDPVVDQPHNFSTHEGCAAISDANGNLLFYTDGNDLYDASFSGPPINVSNGPLGGHSSSANSAIIVPPAGGGSLYHVFAMGTWSANQNNTNGILKYTPVSVSGGIVSIPSPTRDVLDPVHGDDWMAAEAMGATSHVDCDKYWVVALDANRNEWVSILVESDAGPQPGNIVRSPYGAPLPASNVFGMKFSMDGAMIAHANVQAPTLNTHDTPRSRSTYDLFTFDRASGVVTYHSQIFRLGNSPSPYGMEFSPNGRYLYVTDYQRGRLHRHTIAGPGTQTPLSSCALIYNRGDELGALQIGPNGKLYGTKRPDDTLFSIDFPDVVLTLPGTTSQNQTDLGFRNNALAADGSILRLRGNGLLGLTIFTRIADDCVDGACDRLAEEVNQTIRDRNEGLNKQLPYCDPERERPTGCEPLELPPMEPRLDIVWGRSGCDDIESDDVETLLLTVTNPYSNITFCDLKIHKITVTDADGNAVPVLPDGTPSVELIPIGPYCFGKLEGCTDVTREFVIRTRGARSGPYRIRVEGICYEICIHDDMSECFVFEVCRD